jgi:recombination protein RecA
MISKKKESVGAILTNPKPVKLQLPSDKQNDKQPEDMKELVSDLIKSVNKEMGSKCLFNLAEDESILEIKRFFSTGSKQLDYCINNKWDSGFPEGKITEVLGTTGSGKTTLVLSAAAKIQNNGGIIIFIDSERALNMERAKNLGINIKSGTFLYSKENCTEEVFDLIEKTILKLKASGKDVPVFVIWDSVAASIPKAEDEETYDKSSIGLQARQIRKGLRKINKIIDGEKATLVILNHVTLKIGVMFGCFHEETPVTFADGTQFSIREVVENKLEGPVLSWDGTKVVTRKIVGWHDNGILSDEEKWLTFSVQSPGGNKGEMGFTVTQNHVLVTGDGKEVHAKDVNVGDHLLSWYESTLTSEENDLIEGSLLGDGEITPKGQFLLSNTEQSSYLDWKISHFTSVGFTEHISCNCRNFISNATFELQLLRSKFYNSVLPESEDKNYKKLPENYLKTVSLKSLAIWWCDVGYYDQNHERGLINIKRLSETDGLRIAEELATRWPGVRYDISQRAIIFQQDSFEKFAHDIAPHVPEMMCSKLPEKYRCFAKASPLRKVGSLERKLIPVTVTEIRHSKKKHKSKRKFDLTIEGNSFYFVGGDHRGVVVHNSPETTTGGTAIPFWSSLRLKLHDPKPIKDGETVIGVSTWAKVIKNKINRAFREAEFNILFDKGIDESSYVFKILKGYFDNPDAKPVIVNGKKVKIGGSVWKEFSVTDEKTGEVLEQEKDQDLTIFFNKVFNNQKYEIYVKALYDAAYVIESGNTNHVTMGEPEPELEAELENKNEH